MVVVSWDEPRNNGAPITEYRLEWQPKEDLDFVPVSSRYSILSHSLPVWWPQVFSTKVHREAPVSVLNNFCINHVNFIAVVLPWHICMCYSCLCLVTILFPNGSPPSSMETKLPRSWILLSQSRPNCLQLTIRSTHSWAACSSKPTILQWVFGPHGVCLKTTCTPRLAETTMVALCFLIY